jgi:mannose-6-phosphate isomerase
MIRVRIPKFIPLGTNRVWRTYLGGKSLDILEGKEHPEDSHFPEDWIGSTTRANNKGREQLKDEGVSIISLEGQQYLLTDLLEKQHEQILGEAHYGKYGAQMGYLLKFLDSSIRLHIQCHPTAEFAKSHFGSNAGKTEAYVILETRDEVDEPYILMGFQNPPKKQDLGRAIAEQDVEFIQSCFERIPVKPGDVFLVPGGFPHAIGEGVFMIEIMEPTDLVVRIEFERGGYVLPEAARFMGRDVDFALSMFDYNRVTAQDVRERFFARPKEVERFNAESAEMSLIDDRLTRCFSVSRLSVKGSIEKSAEGFYIAIVTGGSGRVESRGEDSMALTFGHRFLVPAQTDTLTFTSEAGMDLILAYPPE